MIYALIEAKVKKEKIIKEQELKEKEKANRELASKKWNYDLMRTFAFNRAKRIFKYEYVVDESNEDVFNLLSYYFCGDKEGFDKQVSIMNRSGMVIEGASIDKGILLCGNFGTGKTDMMKMFQQNPRQVFYMRTARRICDDFMKSPDKQISREYIEPYQNAINDPATLFQPLSGLCIDEIGAESEKNNFGNKANVIGDLIELKYAEKFTGVFFHGTTNLGGKELRDFYGERVTSRMRQIFNFIELPGNDRRK